MSNEKNRYTAEELAEFEVLLHEKLAHADADLKSLRESIANVANDAKGDDFAGEQMTREETQQLATRQEKFIKHLQDAQVRIRNGTYGVCRVTGTLISKERLRLVPHATLNIEPKKQIDNA